MCGLSYAVEQEKWLRSHMLKREGSRLEALKRGHGYGNQLFAEKIWWRLFGHFKGLHPEYEVLDWRGFPFYPDFVWMIGTIRIIFEIQDYGTHIQNMDHKKHRRELNRAMFMHSLQYTVINIALDELQENPDLVLSILRNILAPYLNLQNQIDNTNTQTNTNTIGVNKFSKVEKELMRLAIRQNRLLRPIEAARELEMTTKTTIKYLNQLVEKKKFRAIPSGVTGRVTQYEYIGSSIDSDLF
jgi:hypothetical protein